MKIKMIEFRNIAASARFTKVPLIKNVEDNGFFPTQKLPDSDNFPFLFLKSKKCASHFCRKTTNKNKQLNKQKTWISKSYLIKQCYLWKSSHLNHADSLFVSYKLTCWYDMKDTWSSMLLVSNHIICPAQ